MATRNLFRFVSVRPPSAAEARRECQLVDEDSATEFVKAVRERQGKHDESLEPARRALSKSFIDSDDYFTRSDAWRDLRPLRKRFQKIITRTCQPEEEPTEKPEPGAALEGEESVRKQEAFAAQVRDWVVDDPDSFAEAKSILWRSYYANVLVPEVRPNDRAEMVEWIWILDALVRLEPSAGDRPWRYDKNTCACVKRLERARVHIPQQLFAEEPAPDSPQDRPVDDTDDYKESYQYRLERLRTARSAVDNLYRRKVSALRLTGLNQPSGPKRERTPQEQSDAKSAVAAGEQPDLAPQAPWLLTNQDAEDDPKLAEELDRLGIPMIGALVSEVTDALDEAISAGTTALVELESRVDLLGIGTAMTVARSTRRGFRPGGRDGEGVHRGSDNAAVDAEPDLGGGLRARRVVDAEPAAVDAEPGEDEIR